MTPCEQTALAYQEAHRRHPGFSGSTSAYQWTTIHEGRTCAECLEALKDGHDTAIRSVESEYRKKYGPWHHVRCFDWRTLDNFTKSGHYPPRSKTTTLAKALKAPRFRVTLQQYGGQSGDYYSARRETAFNHYGTSKKLREELIAEAKRQHPCPDYQRQEQNR